MAMELGGVLKAVRLKAGLSQKELAERILINQSEISRIEKNRRVPDAITFLKWFRETNTSEVAAAMICGIDPQALMDFVQQVMQFSELISAVIFTIANL